MVSAPFTRSFFLDGCGKRNNVPCLLQQRHVYHAPAERECALQKREHGKLQPGSPIRSHLLAGCRDGS